MKNMMVLVFMMSFFADLHGSENFIKNNKPPLPEASNSGHDSSYFSPILANRNSSSSLDEFPHSKRRLSNSSNERFQPSKKNK